MLVFLRTISSHLNSDLNVLNLLNSLDNKKASGGQRRLDKPELTSIVTYLKLLFSLTMKITINQNVCFAITHLMVESIQDAGKEIKSLELLGKA